MPRRDTDRNLLFGITAIQQEFITRDALIAAMNDWVLEKHRPIGDILVERNALNPDDRAALDHLLDRQIARHGGDPAVSLAAMSSVSDIASDIRREVADADIQQSLTSVSPSSVADPFATRAAVLPEPPLIGSRYRQIRKHAQGGLGVVFVARDEELNRNVALKEIQDRYVDDPGKRARFLLEAEVTGGLEHPGIVPVYGLGSYIDGRPYYAMRFIKGDSLKEAIAQFHADDTLKHEPGQRTLALQKLLRRFTDVCNAIDYAHSRGVLHRDLKPDNVMVGKHGETLVVDWGLAKATGLSGIDENVATLPEETLQPASASASDATRAGAVIGTPAYMSPEQAAGRLDLFGPATDVYGLGATLYTLLTGRVPFVGPDGFDGLAKVERGEFRRPRESSPWLDPALEAICLKAMALRPDARYATPKALSDDVDRWIAGEPVAAYPEPWTRRARRWVRKHRTAVTTAAASAMVAALLLGGFAWRQISQRQKADNAASTTLTLADRFAIDARSSGKPADWIKAVAEARRAVDQLESGGSPSLRSQATARLDAFRAEEARRLADIRMVAALDEARLMEANTKDGHFDTKAKLHAYLDAFRVYGIDVAKLPTEDATRYIRSSPITDHLIVALDDWISHNQVNVLPSRLMTIARAAESDPKRAAIRDMVARRDAAGLRRLCERGEDRRKLGPRLRYVFDSLLTLEPKSSLPLLEVILRENPSDFWMNHNLGMAYSNAKPPQAQEAVRCISVAVALRPDSAGVYNNLGQALDVQGKADQAIAAFREAIRHKPDYAEAHCNLGTVLIDQGKADQAIAEFREAIRHKPDLAEAHSALGSVLDGQGKADEAIVEYRQAIRLKPDYAEAHYNFGIALYAQGKADQAIAEFREAIRHKPDFAEPHYALGIVLDGQGKADEAIVEYRQAIRHKLDYTEAHYNLGNALRSQGKIDEAIAAFREAIRHKLDYAEAHCNLGLILQRLGRFREALDSLEQGHTLGSKQSGWQNPSGDWVHQARRLVELEAKLPAILKSEATPKDVPDRLALADMCSKKGLQAASARFYGEAFAEQPALADDLANGHRYNAACAASLAGSGSGKDDPKPDEAARARWRAQALAWLRSDLTAWSKVLDGGDEATRKTIAPTLAHWKEDADLAGIRDDGALATMPKEEQEALRSLWADVEALRKKAGGAEGR